MRKWGGERVINEISGHANSEPGYTGLRDERDAFEEAFDESFYPDARPLGREIREMFDAH